jgi:hypothetical protein
VLNIFWAIVIFCLLKIICVKAILNNKKTETIMIQFSEEIHAILNMMKSYVQFSEKFCLFFNCIVEVQAHEMTLNRHVISVLHPTTRYTVSSFTVNSFLSGELKCHLDLDVEITSI